jgi:biopolymer transport protein ExbB/TolQ
MATLFQMGGPIFMGILTLLLLLVFILSIVSGLTIASGNISDDNSMTHQLSYIKSIGLLSVATGFLSQLIGLFLAFNAIERVGDISPQIVMGGLKVSLIAPVYGISIYLVSLILWLVLDLYHRRVTKLK